MTAEIAAPKPEPDAKAKKERFWSIKKKNTSTKIEKIWCQITIATFMQPLQYDFTTPSCKRQWYYAASRSSQDPWCSHYSAICRDRLAKHNRTTRTVPEIEAAKPEPDAKAKKERFWSIKKKKTPAPKLRKFGARSLSQPSCSRSITIHDSQLQKTMVLRSQPQPAAAARILDAAITVRSAETDLQSTIELRARCQKLKLQNPSPAPKRKRTILRGTF